MQQARFRRSLLLATYTVALVFFFYHLGFIGRQVAGFMGVVRPFVYGFVIAFLLNRPMVFVEERVLPRLWRGRIQRTRGPALLFTYLLVIFLVTNLFSIVLPQLIGSMVTLAGEMDGYVSVVNQWVGQLLADYPIDPRVMQWISGYWAELLNAMGKLLAGLAPLLMGAAKGITSGVTNLLIGFVVSIYLLLGKEKFILQCKKLVYAFVPVPYGDKVMEVARLTNRIFGGFIGGKIAASAIVGLLTFLGMAIFKMPYALLAGVVVGCTNVIPFFGPFLGAIPCAFIILIRDPLKALGFVVMITVIQQVDGNYLSPKMVGQSVGIGGVWVLFAILVGGGLWGLPGLVVGLPIFAVLYALVGELTHNRLRRRGRSPQDPEAPPHPAPVDP